ncbi:MAG TPA: VWA domain-containing protein [Pyrinomonadaceae bacterium]|nr:VWA domain-containing protein [Pyrinomonadaceae bacterium]
MKKQQTLTLCLAVSLVAAPVAGQQSAPTTPVQQQQQTNTPPDEVVRVTSNLVQVDVSVTDKDGKPVADLRPEDFEIYEDGRRREITNFSFVSQGARVGSPQTARADATRASSSAGKTPAPVAPAAPLRREQVRRTVALVVDDLGLSLESMASVRRALRKFVDEQIKDGDMVAILRTRGGAGTLESFTNERRKLYAAIERIRWFPVGRADDISAAGTLQPDAADALGQKALRELLEFRRESLGVGTLNALNFAVRGMRELPGRKSVVLFSESFLLTNSVSNSSVPVYNDLSTRMGRAMQKLTEQANRTSTVIYTINPGGLQTLGLTAADGRPALSPDLQLQTLNGSSLGGSPGPNNATGGNRSIRPGQGTTEAGIENLRAATDARQARFTESQEVLDYLARETGGISIRNANDLNEGLERVLQDQTGFYLIGYRPDEQTFDRKTGRPAFKKLSVSVKRAGLKVRTRGGFVGVEDVRREMVAATAAAATVAPAPLRDVLMSPFVSGDLDVRLTSLFVSEPPQGSLVRSLLHIDARGLTFKEAADGTRKAAVEVLAMTFNASGVIVDRVVVTKHLDVRRDAFEGLLQTGLVSVLNVPVKEAGAYQLRVGVRDTASARTGTASQFVEVPDISRERLALSGIVLSGGPHRAAPVAPANAPANLNVGGADADSDPQSGPSLRRVRQGMTVNYGYQIYNAQRSGQSGEQTAQPQLLTQMRLFRDGRAVYTGAEKTLDLRVVG